MEELRQKYVDEIPRKQGSGTISLKQLSPCVNNFLSKFDVKIEDLISDNISQLNFNELVSWCDIYAIRYNLVGMCLGKDHPRYIEFENIKVVTMEMQQYVSDLTKEFKEDNTSKDDARNITVVFRELYRSFGLNIKNFDAESIFEKISLIHNSGYLTLKSIMKGLTFIMEKEEMEDVLKDVIQAYEYKQLNVIEKYKLKSVWKKEFIEQLISIHEPRLDKTSAYPEDCLRKLLEKEIVLLELFEDYIEDNFSPPYGMEPLNWFFSICSVAQVEQMILECSESINCHNEKVKSQNTGHHAKEYVSSCLSLFKNCISNLACKKEISILSMQKILDKIEDKREKPDNIRRHFYEKEIQSMLEEVKHDYQYTLIFRILIEIGLRVGALVKLKTSDLVNLDSTVKREAKVIEKGCTIRSFPVSENIERDLIKYLEQSKPTIWLFPSIRDNTKHISVSAIQDKIKVLSEKLGISGMHMHPHAFRHTLVNKLMSTGNDMTKISRYIGHSSSHTTEKYYWTSTITEVASSMNIPWLSSISIDKISRPVKKEEVVEDNEYEDERTNVITHILLTCIAMFTQEQKTELKKKIPNIDVIIDNLHETTTTTSSHY